MLSIDAVDCGTSGILDADEGGLISSQNYPDNYPNNLNCSLDIRSATGNIVLNIMAFLTYDFLTVGASVKTAGWGQITIPM